MDYSKMSIKQISDGVKQKQFSAESVVKFFLDRIESFKEYNAIIETFSDSIERAREIDRKVTSGEKHGEMAGVPVIIKDNILYKGKHMSCASAFLKDFVSPYSATIVKRLEEAGAIIIARANMDEFAMGGSCEKSVYGATLNSKDKTRVAGGSSGGSAVAVALSLAPVAIGTDTGGSIRQPSSFNGAVGIKPTYGTVSRYGIVAFASSTDQASPITKTIEDNKLVLSVISGKDEKDQTSIENDFGKTKKTYTIGLCKELSDEIEKLEQYSLFKSQIEKLKKMGHIVKEISVPHISSSLACYYVLTPAEATSNLARFDGVKYATCASDAKTLEEVYVKSRSQGFGDEVKRRIMLGNFVLSSGYFDAYYKKAKKLQSLLRKEFERAFEQCDVILTPTTPSVAFKLGEKSKDPTSMYLEDLFTVPASISGIPALSVPYASLNGLPLGLQIMGKNKTEDVLYDIAKQIIGGRVRWNLTL